MLLWLTWYWRNGQLHDASFSWTANGFQLVLGKAKESWDVLGSIRKSSCPNTLVSWSRPPPGFIKVNVDGRARGSPGPSAAGGILIDANAFWVCGFVYRIGIAHALLAELWAGHLPWLTGHL